MLFIKNIVAIVAIDTTENINKFNIVTLINYIKYERTKICINKNDRYYKFNIVTLINYIKFEHTKICINKNDRYYIYFMDTINDSDAPSDDLRITIIIFTCIAFSARIIMIS